MKDLDNKLDAIKKRYQDIEINLSNQDKIDTNQMVALNKEY